ncbi:hypothetical protein KY285_027942 [Solanum tuberosum]|nr:hypothetical protein KY285_027942 [Solanum tuberosum]
MMPFTYGQYQKGEGSSTLQPNLLKTPRLSKMIAKRMSTVWGACNHAFHLHCILKWVNSQSAQAHCPMCRREWQFKE